MALTSNTQSPSTAPVAHLGRPGLAVAADVAKMHARHLAAAVRPPAGITVRRPQLYAIAGSYVVVTAVAVAGVFHR